MPRPIALEFIVEESESEEERVRTPWSIEISLFRDYKADDEEILKACFEFDWSCMRKPKFENDVEEHLVRNELYKGYKIIKNMYRPHSALGAVGSIFSIGLNAYTDILRDNLNIVDNENLKLTDVDMMFIMVNSIKKGIFNPANGLIRF